MSKRKLDLGDVGPVKSARAAEILKPGLKMNIHSGKHYLNKNIFSRAAKIFDL